MSFRPHSSPLRATQQMMPWGLGMQLKVKKCLIKSCHLKWVGLEGKRCRALATVEISRPKQTPNTPRLFWNRYRCVLSSSEIRLQIFKNLSINKDCLRRSHTDIFTRIHTHLTPPAQKASTAGMEEAETHSGHCRHPKCLFEPAETHESSLSSVETALLKKKVYLYSPPSKMSWLTFHSLSKYSFATNFPSWLK